MLNVSNLEVLESDNGQTRHVTVNLQNRENQVKDDDYTIHIKLNTDESGYLVTNNKGELFNSDLQIVDSASKDICFSFREALQIAKDLAWEYPLKNGKSAKDVEGNYKQAEMLQKAIDVTAIYQDTPEPTEYETALTALFKCHKANTIDDAFLVPYNQLAAYYQISLISEFYKSVFINIAGDLDKLRNLLNFIKHLSDEVSTNESFNSEFFAMLLMSEDINLSFEQFHEFAEYASTHEIANTKSAEQNKLIVELLASGYSQIISESKITEIDNTPIKSWLDQNSTFDTELVMEYVYKVD